MEALKEELVEVLAHALGWPLVGRVECVQLVSARENFVSYK